MKIFFPLCINILMYIYVYKFVKVILKNITRLFSYVNIINCWIYKMCNKKQQ